MAYVDVIPNAMTPIVGASQAISATGSSSSITLSTGGTQIRVYNAGTAIAYVRWGSGAQTALVTSVGTPGDLPLFPGAVEVFNKQFSDNTFAAVTGGTACTLYVTVGNGL